MKLPDKRLEEMTPEEREAFCKKLLHWIRQLFGEFDGISKEEMSREARKCFSERYPDNPALAAAFVELFEGLTEEPIVAGPEEL